MKKTKQTKSFDHRISGCPILVPIEYKESHDKIGHYNHCKVVKYYKILDCEKKKKKHQPEPITELKEVIIIWDFAIQTDRKTKSICVHF